MKKDNKKYGSLRTFILSLIFAIAIWVVVGIVNDPDIRNTVTSIPIHYVGTSDLADKGLVIIAPTEKATAAVTLSGKRRDLIKYSDEVYMSVDVSGISTPGEYSLKGTSQLTNTRVSIVRERLGEVNVIAEVLKEKEIPVEIKQNGTLKNSIIKAIPQLEAIKVKGAESEIDAVEKAVISFDASDISEASTIYSDFKLCDEAGTALTKAMTLTPNLETVAVDFTVYEKKSLPVRLKLSEELESKYYLDTDNSAVDKTTVEIGVFEDYDFECVYAEITDTSGETKGFELVEEEGMYIPGDVKTVNVKPAISALVSQHMDISVRAQNLADGRSAAFSDTLTDILLQGPEDAVNNSDIHLIIDLKDLDTGKHRIKARISDERVQIEEEITIDVEIN